MKCTIFFLQFLVKIKSLWSSCHVFGLLLLISLPRFGVLSAFTNLRGRIHDLPSPPSLFSRSLIDAGTKSLLLLSGWFAESSARQRVSWVWRHVCVPCCLWWRCSWMVTKHEVLLFIIQITTPPEDGSAFVLFLDHVGISIAGDDFPFPVLSCVSVTWKLMTCSPFNRKLSDVWL